MKITIQNGKKGLFGGFADNGKVILIDKPFLNKIQEGGEYTCTFKELDRCIIATNLKKVENGGKLIVEITKVEDLGVFIQYR